METKKGDSINVVLAGFMATGKSTVGRLLAKALDYEFVDTDELIVKRCGKPVADVFAEDGEARFRKWEAGIARELGERWKLVIAAGGGMMQNPANVGAFRRHGRIYCLHAAWDRILERVSRDGETVRPLLGGPDPRKRIGALMTERESVYAQFPQVDTTDKAPEQVVAELLAMHRAANF